jgi:hypothetical protein
MTDTYNFTIQQGVTFNPRIFYGQEAFTLKPITGLTKAGRGVMTAVGHGLTQDWFGWIAGVSGMDAVNHKSDEIGVNGRAYTLRYVSADSLMLELDTSRFGAYSSGGDLLYKAPMNLAGYTARMDIRASVDATATIATLTTANAKIILGTGVVELLLPATETAGFTFQQAVYDLELVDGSGKVTRLLDGIITLSKEVTR